MSFSAPGSRTQVPATADSPQARASGEGFQVSSAAGKPQAAPLASSPQVPVSSRSPLPPLLVARYVCTVIKSCRQCFSNYNNWAQHETNFHRWTNRQHGGDDDKPGSDEANLNKSAGPLYSAIYEEQLSVLEKSNAQQKANVPRKEDTLVSTFDFWYCNGVDGCMDGWYEQAAFETHLRGNHAMDWNKPPRSALHTDYLLGPEHGVRLWCGFCNMVYEVSSKESWYSDRIAHIASHFDGTCPDEIWDGDVFGWYFIEIH